MASDGHLALEVIIKFSLANIHPLGGPLQKHVVAVVTVTSANHNIEIENRLHHDREVEDILIFSRTVMSLST